MLRDEILENIKLTFNSAFIESLYWFGNKNGRDIDIFIISTQNILYDQIKKDKLDITIVGKRYIRKLLQLKDPIVIEPLMTGELLSGENYLRIDSLQFNSNSVIESHMKQCSIQILDSANYYLNKRDLEKAYFNFLFSFSYVCYSDYYKQSDKNELILYSKLLGMYKPLSELNNYKKDIASISLGDFRAIKNTIMTYPSQH